MIEPTPLYAVCPTCLRVMHGTSCSDTRAWPWPRVEVGEPMDRFCRDCGTNGNHHDGCLVARCRTCGDQIPACECGDLTAA